MTLEISASVSKPGTYPSHTAKFQLGQARFHFCKSCSPLLLMSREISWETALVNAFPRSFAVEMHVPVISL